jgi:glycosyltransferase involved in cell wall biosynthesis
MRISVIMPVRDGAAYLREALDSIADQAMADLEMIVIDDGSRDDSAAIAAAHRLAPKVASQPPLGLTAALNHGMRLAQGELLAFLDSDDVWPPGRLADMLAIMADPQIDVVYGQVVNANARLVPIAAPLAARLCGAMLIRRAAALRVGEFRTDIAHGTIVDWNSRATAAGLRFQELDRVVLLRRIHGDNLGVRERAGAREDMLRVIRDHMKRKR